MKLADLARRLYERADRWGNSVATLPGGLTMELAAANGELWSTDYSLTLSRPAVMPSETEIEVCRNAFAVPAEASREDDPSSFGVVLKWTISPS